MKTNNLKKTNSATLNTIRQFSRRQQWFARYLTPMRVFNMLQAGVSCVFKQERVRSYPIILKVDISPVCNLRCPFCVHGTTNPKMKAFHKGQRMSVQAFSDIVEQVKHRTSAISLYYLGDPLTHPDLNEFCSVARKAKIYTHISTNFSFSLSDEKIAALVDSGLNHLKVCFDGINQSTYEMTRTGGRIDVVLGNLRRIVAMRNQAKSDMTIEVQYLVHDGNRHELDEAYDRMQALGIDTFTQYPSANYTMEEIHPDNYEVTTYEEKSLLTKCYWPYLSMTIKWNGDAIPCCLHRQDEQYNPLKPPATLMGNVAKQGVFGVWNSSIYRQSRAYVANPKAFKQANPDADQFCDGCKKVCERRKKQVEAIPEQRPIRSLAS